MPITVISVAHGVGPHDQTNKNSERMGREISCEFGASIQLALVL